MAMGAVQTNPLTGNGNFSVVSFTRDNLIDLLARHSGADVTHVREKQQTDILVGHLTALNITTIIVETNYFCRHYLADFNHTYSRAFFDYNRQCTRLHFLNAQFAFSDTELVDFLKGDVNEADFEQFQESYAGFLVIRPLKHAVIGRTCIKPVVKDGDPTKYALKREYHSNIFGHTFSVNTVAFQEQDQAGAACATAALWILFSVTGRLYHHKIPAPVEITQSAIQNIIGETRTHDTPGLNLEQMIQAIRYASLEALAFKVKLVEPRDQLIFKAYIKAFIDGGIPLILTASLWQDYKNLHQKGSLRGKHAFAVTGYSFDNQEDSGSYKPTFKNYPNFILKANSICRLKVHDDQVGIFTDMDIRQDESLTTGWLSTGLRPVRGLVKALAETLLVPLPSLVRTSINEILQYAVNLDKFIRDDFVPHLRPIPSFLRNIRENTGAARLIWDITLVEGHTFKSEIRRNTQISPNIKKEIMKREVPCFIWRAVGYLVRDDNGRDEKEIIEIASDATDYGQRHDSPKIIPYNLELVTGMIRFISNPIVNSTLRRTKEFRSIINALEDAGILIRSASGKGPANPFFLKGRTIPAP